MEMRLLRLLHDRVRAQMTETEALEVERFLLLLECVLDLQTRADEAAREILLRLATVGDLRDRIQQLRRNVAAGRKPTACEGLLLTCFAVFKWALSDEGYSVIFSEYPHVGAEIRRLLANIDKAPFSEAMVSVEKNWGGIDSDPEYDWIALAYIGACGRIVFFASDDFYHKIAACLTCRSNFLLVILAAACFKIPAISLRVDIGSWTDEQYGCMRLLDNFRHLGETAWG